ncbi:MAG: hypothetical protein ACYCSS_14120 [Sulfuriferula sp.]
MRLVALLLILVNFLVFSWIQWGQPGPQPIPAEIHPDKISLLRGSGGSALAPAVTSASLNSIAASTAVPATASQPAAPMRSSPFLTKQPLAASAASLDKAAAKPAPQTKLACLEWGPIAAKRVDDAQARLIKLRLGNRLAYTDTAPYSGPYWVYFPPLASKLAADDKLAELQGLGLKDIAIVRTGAWQNAISMGLYSKEAIANARVADAQKKGVAAKIEARGKASRVFTLNNLTADEHNSLIKMQADFGGPTFKKISCTAP